jgi:putative transposase
MSHNYTANFVHCVFSTKDRRNTIPVESQDRLWSFLGGIVRKLGCDVLAIGGTTNNVHVLITLGPVARLSRTIHKLKANSSRWLGEEGVAFEWQKGYGAFSVSPSMVNTVKAYIRSQDVHHQKCDFAEEFVAILKKAGINFDEESAFS